MTYEAFVDTMEERLSSEDGEAASELVTVVLQTVSEILYRSKPDGLSAPLPNELRTT